MSVKTLDQLFTNSINNIDGESAGRLLTLCIEGADLLIKMRFRRRELRRLIIAAPTLAEELTLKKELYSLERAIKIIDNLLNG